MRKIILFFLVFISLFALVACEDDAPIDRINSYQIWIAPNSDATLNMRYQITWTVQKASASDPLTWVKIGIANKHVSNVRGISDNIKKIYSDSDDGSVIHIDFDESYYEGDTFTFEFSFKQSFIYTLDGNFIHYEFIPGWFEDIKVTSLCVYWLRDDVYNVNTSENDETYFIWRKSLNEGESIQLEVNYQKSALPDYVIGQDAKNADKDDNVILIIVVVGVLVGILVLLLILKSTSDPYYQYRGFTPYYHHYWIHPHYGVNREGVKLVPPSNGTNSHGHSGGSGCACACACACAGGGRAGCSRKDFTDKNQLSQNKTTEEIK